jgi:hypothetical protein
MSAGLREKWLWWGEIKVWQPVEASSTTDDSESTSNHVLVVYEPPGGIQFIKKFHFQKLFQGLLDHTPTPYLVSRLLLVTPSCIGDWLAQWDKIQKWLFRLGCNPLLLCQSLCQGRIYWPETWEMEEDDWRPVNSLGDHGYCRGTCSPPMEIRLCRNRGTSHCLRLS